MSADLALHTIVGCTENDVKDFSSNCLGSKYFGVGSRNRRKKDEELFTIMCKTPHVEISELSTLKAFLFGDNERYVPSTAEIVMGLVGEDFPTLDEELKDRILAAFDEHNSSGYTVGSRVKVEEFLMAQMGRRLFTVVW